MKTIKNYSKNQKTTMGTNEKAIEKTMFKYCIVEYKILPAYVPHYILDLCS